MGYAHIRNIRRGTKARNRVSTSWWRDFAWENGRLLIRKTGIRLSVTWPLVHEVVNWAIYLMLLQMVSICTFFRRGQRPTIWFTPDTPRPWYLLRGAAVWAGIDIARSPGTANIVAYFDDATVGSSAAFAGISHLNFACVDIRKSHVAHIFADVFGYPLSVDPLTTQGELVEKPEKNGVHGGHILIGPVSPKRGFTYQRVVDTRDEFGQCHDLRTLCVAGKPVLVWVKTKASQNRFSIVNRKAVLRASEDMYTASEITQIEAFCGRMGLDWGGLDILRDRHDGRIYIVDVNKTDLGPVIALSWRDKVRSMQILSRALSSLVRGFSEQPTISPQSVSGQHRLRDLDRHRR